MSASNPNSGKWNLAPALALLAGLVVCGLAITNQSLWIDEAETAVKAIQPTLNQWWQALYAEHNSNLQLPLYMVYIWCWARGLGASEIALRAANVPWYLFGILAVFRFTRRVPRFRIPLLLVYFIHPFIWYYLDEARPYLMQFPGACILAGCLITGLDEGDEDIRSLGWWIWFAVGTVLVCGSGLLGIPWAAAVVLALLVTRKREFLNAARTAGSTVILITTSPLMAMAIYYAWTLKEGVRAGMTGMNYRSIPWVFYENLGFAGLGPGRADLRLGDISLFKPYLLSLCVLAVPLGYGFVKAVRVRFGLSRRALLWVCIAIVIPVAFTFTLGFAKQFRVVGRHLTPMVPYVILAEAFIVQRLWKSHWLDKAAAGVIVLGLLASSCEYRFAYRHSKDDYRDAAAFALDGVRAGKYVWWDADISSAQYYRLPLSFDMVPGQVRMLANNWLPADLTRLPDVVVLSKPDLSDPTGAIRALLADRHYRLVRTFPSVTIWER